MKTKRVEFEEKLYYHGHQVGDIIGEVVLETSAYFK